MLGSVAGLQEPESLGGGPGHLKYEHTSQTILMQVVLGSHFQTHCKGKSNVTHLEFGYLGGGGVGSVLWL